MLKCIVTLYISRKREILHFIIAQNKAPGSICEPSSLPLEKYLVQAPVVPSYPSHLCADRPVNIIVYAR